MEASWVRCRGPVLVLSLLVPAAAAAQEARVSNVAKGEFTVAMKPLALEGVDASAKLGRMSIDKRIAGDLVATTQGQMLPAATDVQRSAICVALGVQESLSQAMRLRTIKLHVPQ